MGSWDVGRHVRIRVRGSGEVVCILHFGLGYGFGFGLGLVCHWWPVEANNEVRCLQPLYRHLSYYHRYCDLRERGKKDASKRSKQCALPHFLSFSLPLRLVFLL